MNIGIKTLIERMQTNPEEFSRDSRWRMLVADFRADLTPEDLEAFDEAFKKCRQEEFTSKVVQRLLTEEREDRNAIEGFGLAPMKNEGKRVRLNSGEVSAASKMGITLEHYADMKHELEEYKKEWAQGKKL